MSDQQEQARVPSTARPRRALLILAVLLIGGAALAFWLVSRGRESTDDAQIEGDLVPISPRVNGYVRSIEVAENQEVKAGDLLVQLDRRDLEVRAQSAEANLAMQQAQAAAAAGQVSVVQRTAPAGELQAGAGLLGAGAGIAASETQVASAEAQAGSAEAGVEVARAAVASAKSDLESAATQIQGAQAALQAAQADVQSAGAQAKRTASDAARFRDLYTQGAASKQELDAMEAGDASAQAALHAARDRVESAKAALEQARAQRTGAEAGLAQAKGRLSSALSAAAQAQAGIRSSKAVLSQARARFNEARAVHSAAQTAPQQVLISRAQSSAAAARIKQAAADLHNARLQLSYTRITAPVAGVVSKKSVEPGQFVQAGQLLMAIVPLEKVWVVANFKETQVGRMLPGQKARIQVDSYPGRTFWGRIQSIGAATGAKFSLLPPENATGNFVKVVQRIPVKILFDQPMPKGVLLRPGQSVAATVYVSGGRG